MYHKKPTRSEGVEDFSRPDSPVQSLMDLINNMADARKKKPAMMPAHPQEAANWWIGLQEPPSDDEVPIESWTKPRSQTDIPTKFWKTPYNDRLVDTLKIFYNLSHAYQMYIIDLHSQGIWWRGDSIEFMKVRESVDVGKIDTTAIKSQMGTVIFG